MHLGALLASHTKVQSRLSCLLRVDGHSPCQMFYSLHTQQHRDLIPTIMNTNHQNEPSPPPHLHLGLLAVAAAIAATSFTAKHCAWDASACACCSVMPGHGFQIQILLTHHCCAWMMTWHCQLASSYVAVWVHHEGHGSDPECTRCCHQRL